MKTNANFYLVPIVSFIAIFMSCLLGIFSLPFLVIDQGMDPSLSIFITYILGWILTFLALKYYEKKQKFNKLTS